MSELIVARFDSSADAFAATKALTAMGQSFEIEPEDIEVVTRSAGNRVAILPEVNTALAQSVGGAIWGGVLGAVFLIPVLGAGLGAVAGWFIGRRSDVGISRAYLSRVARDIGPGQAAVALLARRVDPAALKETLSRFGGRIMRSTLSGRHEDQIVTEMNADAGEIPEKADLRNQPELA